MSLFSDPLSEHLTPAAHDRAARDTHPGQAHWAGTGPETKTCRECAFWAHDNNYYSKRGKHHGLIRPARCRKYRALMNIDGGLVPGDAAACRHFDQANPVPPQFVSSK